MTTKTLQLKQPVKIFHKEITPLAESATSIQIMDKDTLIMATELLSALNTYNDKITSQKDQIIRPALDIISVERKRWQPLEALLKPSIDLLRSKISTYQTDLINRQRIQEEAISSRISSGKGHYSLATGLKKLDAVLVPQARIDTATGSLRFNTRQEVLITDKSKIPLIYLETKDSLILADLKKNITIPGAELVERQVPINVRNK